MEKSREQLEALVRERTRELEAANADLRESEERFRLLVDGAKDHAIYLLDPDGRVMSWNSGAQIMKGYKEQEIIGRHLSSFYVPEDVERGKPEWLLKTAAEHGVAEDQGWRVRKDGSRFWASVAASALWDDSGRLRGFSKVTRDITVHKRAEEALRQSEERLAAIIGSAMDAIVTVDKDQRIIVFNTAAEQMFRLSRSRGHWPISGALHSGALPRSPPQPCAKVWFHWRNQSIHVFPRNTIRAPSKWRGVSAGSHHFTGKYRRRKTIHRDSAGHNSAEADGNGIDAQRETGDRRAVGSDSCT